VIKLGFLDRIFNRGIEINKSVGSGAVDMRPIEVAGRGGLVEIPDISIDNLYICESMFYKSDILRLVIKSLIMETTRNGLEIKPKFNKKCTKCGNIVDISDDKCGNCGNSIFRKPNEFERNKLNELMKSINLNKQSLLDVITDILYNINIYDNAYCIVRKQYMYNKNGQIIGAKPIEVISGDVYKIHLIISKDGRIGMNDYSNKYIAFCPEHRNEKYEVDDIRNAKCPICGKQVIRAVAYYNIDGRYYLGEGEIKHVKKFTHSIGYGYSPILTLLRKILILLEQERYIQKAYSLERPPKGLLFLKANRNSVLKAWEMAKKIAQQNPHSLAPIAIEDFSNTQSGKIAEYVDLSFSLEESRLEGYRQEIRRQIASFYGIGNIYQNDMEGAGGLNSEGLQITITNKAIAFERKLVDDLIEWILKQYGIQDYKIILRTNEEIDISAKIKRERDRLELCERLMNLGYDVKIYEDENSELQFKLEGKIQQDISEMNGGADEEEQLWQNIAQSFNKNGE
jgi:predicted RNA-binding Zn-ribbon protein involved in translation (DUF1610 family)